MLPEKREKLVFSVFIIFVLCLLSYIAKKTYDTVNDMSLYLKDNIHYQNEYIRGMVFQKKKQINPPKIPDPPKQELNYLKKQALYSPAFFYYHFLLNKQKTMLSYSE